MQKKNPHSKKDIKTAKVHLLSITKTFQAYLTLLQYMISSKKGKLQEALCVFLTLVRKVFFFWHKQLDMWQRKGQEEGLEHTLPTETSRKE